METKYVNKPCLTAPPPPAPVFPPGTLTCTETACELSREAAVKWVLWSSAVKRWAADAWKLCEIKES